MSDAADAYRARPWLAHYPPSVPPDLPAPSSTLRERFASTVARVGHRPCFHYFDRTLTFADVDTASSAVAMELFARGVGHGDRVALYLQSDPEFAIAQLATWKVGAVVVSVNPMLREGELEHVLVDSGSLALVTSPGNWHDVAAKVVSRTEVRFVLLADPRAWTRDTPPSDVAAQGQMSTADFHTVLATRFGQGPVLRRTQPSLTLDDLALICYTSGTSGKPKGVMTTHRNLSYNADVYRVWMDLSERDVFVMGTPIFHITGLVAGLAVCYSVGMSIALFHRFDAGEWLRAAHRRGATFCIMAITAYQNVLGSAAAARTDLHTLAKVYSGGAPVTAAIADAWCRLTGTTIHNVYGLTETTSPSHMIPLGSAAPVDRTTGVLSIGFPVPGAEVRVVDPTTGADVRPGERGEIWIRGPMVAAGYWKQPEATEETFVDGYLRTGDIGFMDDAGWFFVIDRLKDMINAAGYKVWPREVEELLLGHPALDEVAVVGVPDPYRGETVKAFITLRPGQHVEPHELVAYAKGIMAAYKYPRTVEIVAELPKTVSGKVLRRELRAQRAARDSGGLPASLGPFLSREETTDSVGDHDTGDSKPSADS